MRFPHRQTLGCLALAQATSGCLTKFDARESTVDSIHHSLLSGQTTCRGVVSSFISRIITLNNHTNAIVILNPNALAIADSLDHALSTGNATGTLFCIPVLLKDNFNTADLPTTGGSLALTDSRPSIDAPSVEAFRKAGAVIIGKTNLHELALEGLSVSSLGGQTINPFDSTRTPGGSSGGTGAALAASFAVIGTGTDTVNSLRSPASANSLFSIRPTWGLISRSGVIPCSYTQDVVGPIARNVKDLAIALTVMASRPADPKDNSTALFPPGLRNFDYAAAINDAPSLKCLRLGVLEGFFNRNSSSPEVAPVNDAMNTMLARLRAAGAILIPINETLYNTTALLELDTQRWEFREVMDAYLSGALLLGRHPATLAEFYNTPNANGTGGKFLIIPSQYNFLKTAFQWNTGLASYAENAAKIAALKESLRNTFDFNGLDAIIYPEQKNLVVPIGSPSQSGRNGILAALTGTPVVVVPAGFSNETSTAERGIPIGMEILGREWNEGRLLGIAKRIEELGRVRRVPKWAEVAVEMRQWESVPVVRPNAENVSPAYPVGVRG